MNRISSYIKGFVSNRLRANNITVSPEIGQTLIVSGESPVPIRIDDPQGVIEHAQVEFSADGQNTREIIQLTKSMEPGSSVHAIFTAEIRLNPGSRIHFGVRYRRIGESHAQWIDGSDSDTPAQVGVIVNQHIDTEKVPESVSLSFQELFSETDDSLKITPVSSDVFRVTARGSADPQSATHKTLGKPVSMIQWISWVRSSPYWLQPRTGTKQFSLDNNAVGLGYQREDGLHVAVLPLSGLSDNTTSYIQSTADQKSILLYGQNDSADEQDTAIDVLIGYGSDLADVLATLFDHSKTLIHGTSVIPSIPPIGSSGDTWKPLWVDGFMYCTWNGLGLNMTHDKIIDALQDLHNSGLRISGIIIDDGWQSTAGDRQLYDFEAKEDHFPKGLKGLVSDIKTKFPYIENIGVWSTIVGYWNGFIHDSKVDKTFKTIDVPYESEGKTIRIPDLSDVKKFYQTYFSFLADAGITCVKIDNQATLNKILDPKIRGRFWKVYQDELWAAAVKYFQGRIIYCMAMVPDIMLYSLQRRVSYEQTPVFRNSDDFFPYVMDSHFWHQYTNLYSAIYTRNLNALPDYDMFQSQMQRTDDIMYVRFPQLHAAVRSISGGPIYFTDTPDQHNVSLLKSFSARDSTGRDIVLRLDGAPTPVDPYRSFDSTDGLLKVTNQYGPSSGVLGLFNITKNKYSEYVSIKDFKFASRNYALDEYALRSYKSGDIWNTLSEEEKVAELESGEWDIITAAPFIPVSKGSSYKVALFGLINNMSGVAAIHSHEFEVKRNGVLVTVQLKAFGMLALTTNFSLSGEAQVDTFVAGGDGQVVKIHVDDEKWSSNDCGKGRSLIQVKIFLPSDKV